MIYIDGNCPYKFNIINTQILKYPPTKNRMGKTKSTNDIKTIVTIQTNLVKVPTLITSDLHSHTEGVLNDLESNNINIRNYLVISLGDMSGDMIFGSDGDSTNSYERINKSTDQYYIIQGNHDLPPKDTTRLTNMLNKNGSHCMISDGEKIVNTPNGTMGGVHGTISFKIHPYKKTPDCFYALMENILKLKKPNIILSHETPAIPILKPNGTLYNMTGNTELFQLICKYKPKVHMYGHCHHPYVISYVKGIVFINADARIVLLEPIN